MFAGKLACARHIDKLCQCPPSVKVLKYRYTVPELEDMLSLLATQTGAYTSWVSQVEAALDSPENSKTGEKILSTYTFYTLYKNGRKKRRNFNNPDLNLVLSFDTAYPISTPHYQFNVMLLDCVQIEALSCGIMYSTCIRMLLFLSPLEIQNLKNLQTEATSRGFTSSEIYDELTVTLQDVDKCMDTATRIVEGRLRGKGVGGKVVDVQGLKCFLQEVQGLPCHLPQAEPLRVSLVWVCVC